MLFFLEFEPLRFFCCKIDEKKTTNYQDLVNWVYPTLSGRTTKKTCVCMYSLREAAKKSSSLNGRDKMATKFCLLLACPLPPPP